MYKAGTVKEILALKEKMPEEVYFEALSIVTMLDIVYGENRDVDKDDGGFVFVAENKDDLNYFGINYMKLEKNLYEAVKLVRSKKEPYLNVFFLCNNEYGINLFIPMPIVPEIIFEKLTGRDPRQDLTRR